MSLSNHNSVLTLEIELQCICITFIIHHQNLSSCKFKQCNGSFFRNNDQGHEQAITTCVEPWSGLKLIQPDRKGMLDVGVFRPEDAAQPGGPNYTCHINSH